MMPIVFPIVGATFIEDHLGTLKPLRRSADSRASGGEMADVSLDARGAVTGGVPGELRVAHPYDPNGDAQDWLGSIERSNLTLRYYLTVGRLVPAEDVGVDR